MKQEIILVGGGGHCQSVIDVIEQEGTFQIKGILDVPEKLGHEVTGYTSVGSSTKHFFFPAHLAKLNIKIEFL